MKASNISLRLYKAVYPASVVESKHVEERVEEAEKDDTGSEGKEEEGGDEDTDSEGDLVAALDRLLFEEESMSASSSSSSSSTREAEDDTGQDDERNRGTKHSSSSHSVSLEESPWDGCCYEKFLLHWLPYEVSYQAAYAAPCWHGRSRFDSVALTPHPTGNMPRYVLLRMVFSWHSGLGGNADVPGLLCLVQPFKLVMETCPWLGLPVVQLERSLRIIPAHCIEHVVELRPYVSETVGGERPKKRRAQEQVSDEEDEDHSTFSEDTPVGGPLFWLIPGVMSNHCLTLKRT